jgi:hypothetical protein
MMTKWIIIDIFANGKKGKVFFLRYERGWRIVFYKKQLTGAFRVQVAE